MTEEEKRNRRERDEKAQGLVLGLLGTGSGAVVYGAVRFSANGRLLERGLFRPSFWGSGGLVGGVVGVMGVVVWGGMGRGEEEGREG